ncbi:response regulator receiver protein [Fulvivirga imtechensis AK7]|uniref:Response regulator receiver protein n=1 Tax=Fulvivirga imtechensis AK7 TaxID=1237149 RepID=L8JU64_9BACT|nr:LytTR family DNA-binding domain-containing protein [Fulvivirga imtechensis]ELR71094.1 response regulator receiver protein [Fulvivirga imtechensis AK7]
MKNKITCIIVDDEKEAREGLALMVSKIEDIDLVGVCSNGIDAIYSINEYNPDLLLLDIQMSQINGFEVLRHIKKHPAAIIFVTAYDQYALQAFEVHALDYLLKPFSDHRFYDAIDRAREKIGHRRGRAEIQALLAETKKNERHKDSVYYTKGASGEKIVIKTGGNIHLVPVEEVRYVEAYDYYIKIHVHSNYFLIRETMKNMMVKLPENIFVRIHKSYIVNLNCIAEVENTSATDTKVILNTGEQVKVSRTYKMELIERFK